MMSAVVVVEEEGGGKSGGRRLSLERWVRSWVWVVVRGSCRSVRWGLGVGRRLERRLPPGDGSAGKPRLVEGMSLYVGGGESDVVNRVGGGKRVIDDDGGGGSSSNWVWSVQGWCGCRRGISSRSRMSRLSAESDEGWGGGSIVMVVVLSGGNAIGMSRMPWAWFRREMS